MAKDYIIFDSAPIINFHSEVPFNCEANFPDSASWYAAQTRDTRKPRPKVFGTISTSNCASSFSLQDISANISVHGNYTAYYRQKSFKLKLDTPRNLFGLNKGNVAKDWLLMADYGDNSKLRNALALYMGQQFLRTTWSATFTFVHVYIDNEYYGLYLLTDAKTISQSRININDPEEGYQGVDIGYFFERDDYLTYDAKDPGFVISYPDEYIPNPLPIIAHETNTSYGVDARYRDEYSISSKIYSENQIAFIKKYTQLVYTILYKACVSNVYYEINSDDISEWQTWHLVQSSLTDPVDVVSKVVDVNSFVDMYLLQEIAGNPDLAHSSYYLCVDMSPTGSKKLACCCPWDFDRAFGISNGLPNASTLRLWAKDAHYNPWVSLMPQAGWFVRLLKQRFQELQANNIFNKCLEMLADYSTTYESDFAQNYTKYNIRWEGDLDGWVNNGNPATIGTLNASYYRQINTEAEAKELLSTWFTQRIAALPNAFIYQEDQPVIEGFAAPVITFTFSNPFTCEDALFDNFIDWYTQTSENTARPRANGTITLSDCPEEFIMQDIEADIKVRGNYTASYSKKPFQIRFKKKQNLFGLNNGKKAKKWLLLAEYNDSSMLRNLVAFYMAHQIFSNTWVVDYKLVHVYIQSGNYRYYQGLYLLTDNKEQNDSRVDVFEPEDGYEGTDIGYLFERDDYFQSETDPTFFIGKNEYLPVAPIVTNAKSNSWARQNQGIQIAGDGYSIHSTITSQAQVDFLCTRMKRIYELMYRAIYYQQYLELTDDNQFITSSENTPVAVLNKTINLNSFVERFILEEIVCNPDIGHSSFYFSLDMSSKGDKRLALACPWDYDLSMGLAKGFMEDPTAQEFYAKECTLNPWISMLANAPWFMELVRQKWQELWDSAFCSKVFKLINNYSSLYTQDFEKNFEEWSIVWEYNKNKTWNLDGRAYVFESGIVIVNGIHPLQNVRSLYGLKSRISTEADCKNFLLDWIASRFWVVHTLFGGVGDTFVEVLPDPIPTGVGAYYCIKKPNGYILKPVQILGANQIRTILGNTIPPSNVAKLIYDIKKLRFRTFFRLDLETGGEHIAEFNAYTNWFPGCTTYGFIRYNDTDIYIKDAQGNYIKTDAAVPHYGAGQAKENSTVEILEPIDGIDMNMELRRKLQPMWHIRTNSGIEGYINATNVSDIFYNVKNS